MKFLEVTTHNEGKRLLIHVDSIEHIKEDDESNCCAIWLEDGACITTFESYDDVKQKLFLHL